MLKRLRFAKSKFRQIALQSEIKATCRRNTARSRRHWRLHDRLRHVVAFGVTLAALQSRLEHVALHRDALEDRVQGPLLLPQDLDLGVQDLVPMEQLPGLFFDL